MISAISSLIGTIVGSKYTKIIISVLTVFYIVRRLKVVGITVILLAIICTKPIGIFIERNTRYRSFGYHIKRSGDTIVKYTIGMLETVLEEEEEEEYEEE